MSTLAPTSPTYNVRDFFSHVRDEKLAHVQMENVVALGFCNGRKIEWWEYKKTVYETGKNENFLFEIAFANSS